MLAFVTGSFAFVAVVTGLMLSSVVVVPWVLVDIEVSVLAIDFVIFTSLLVADAAAGGVFIADAVVTDVLLANVDVAEVLLSDIVVSGALLADVVVVGCS